MVSEEVTKLVSEYNTNLWTDPIPKNKIHFIDQAIDDPSRYAVYKPNASEADIKKQMRELKFYLKH